MKFARQEKIALIFLLASLFVGEAVSYYKKANIQSNVMDSRPSTSLRACFRGNDKESGNDRESQQGISDYKKVNINEATEKELIRLNRIGPVLAGRIISYREKYGPFRRAEELKKVKGIGDRAYEKIKQQIILE